jgi:RNA polymerase sigma factor (TIGR02999 family)
MDAMISALSGAANGGDSVATDLLFSSLYSELHRIAKRELARQWSRMNLSVTTLLHEAYLNMAHHGDDQMFSDRARFMGYASRVMRGLIVDHVRARSAGKRGGSFEITSLNVDVAEQCPDSRELSAISDALDQLAKVEPELAEIVDLKFFCGFTFEEIGAMHKISERTVQRRWEMARVFLHCNISPISSMRSDSHVENVCQ